MLPRDQPCEASVNIAGFYNDLAPWYHAIFEDWDGSMARQGAALHRIIATEWGPAPKAIVDVAAGIGTQSIPLAQLGHRIIAGDCAIKAVARAGVEAGLRDVQLAVLATDMRSLPIRAGWADVVVACDNALPHLLSEAEIAAALCEFHRCLRPGGGCLVTMRDYGACPPDGTRERRPYGKRLIDGRLHEVCQTWTWEGPRYNLVFEIVAVATGEVVLAAETTYFAIRPARVMELMAELGFAHVRRVDEGYYQPILVGTRPLPD